MLPKKNRFANRLSEDFFKNAKRAYSPLFVLFYQQRKDNLPAKAAIIIPKKIIKQAVVRNKLKRQIKAALIPYFKKTKNNNLVFYLKTNHNIDFEIIKNNLKKLLTQLV